MLDFTFGAGSSLLPSEIDAQHVPLDQNPALESWFDPEIRMYDATMGGPSSWSPSEPSRDVPYYPQSTRAGKLLASFISVTMLTDALKAMSKSAAQHDQLPIVQWVEEESKSVALHSRHIGPPPLAYC